MNPFGNYGVSSRDEDDMSDGETQAAEVQALMRADLEVSPLVGPIPPMPTNGGGPRLPTSTRDVTTKLAPKKRKPDDDADPGSQFLKPPDAKRPAVNVSIQGFGSTEGRLLPPDATAKKIMGEGEPLSASVASASSSGVVGQHLMPPPPPPRPPQASQGTDFKAIYARVNDNVPQSETASTVLKEVPPATLKSETRSLPQPDGAVSGQPVPSSVSSSETKAEPGARKRKKQPPKPVRRVLIAKRERLAAVQLLNDFNDLRAWLSEEDCLFLAEKAWIFTKQQLEAVLDPSSIADRFSNMVDEAKAQRKALLDHLVQESATRSGGDVNVGSESVDMKARQHIDGNKKNPFNMPTETFKGGAVGEGRPADEPVAAESRSQDSTSTPGQQEKTIEELPLQRTSCVDPTEDIEKRFEAWLATIRGACQRKIAACDQFPLQGAVSVLLPNATKNFLSSTTLTHAFQLLASRKTETGAITDLLRVWRSECALEAVGQLALAKHIQGVGWRLQSVLKSPVPPAASARTWMNDGIVVLTGAARDFLVDAMRVFTLKRFLEYRTKDLANRLVIWREEHGFPPLKGSGKVAMISGWKACAREESQIHENEGKVVEKDLMLLSSQDVPIILDESKSEMIGTPRTHEPARRARMQNADSSDFHTSEVKLETVLGKEVEAVLLAAGIASASDLVDIELSSELTTKLMQSNLVNSEEECSSRLDAWKDLVRSHMRIKQEQEDKPRVKASNEPRRRRIKLQSDPFEALSASTQRFLQSIGITTAEDFLSTRTTDIAADFVKWREQEGKPELKGLGAIASVSGWKANCRKAATEMGMDDVAMAEPDSTRSPWVSGRLRTSASRGHMNATKVPLYDAAMVNMESILSGNSRVELKVQGDNERFQFYLSLRMQSTDHPVRVFLTYRGCLPRFVSNVALQKVSLRNVDQDSSSSVKTILDEPSGYRTQGAPNCDPRRPFSSLDGVVPVSKAGVVPVIDQDLHLLQEACLSFCRQEALQNVPAARKDEDYNVAVCLGSVSPVYLFYASGSFEKGQSVELRFPSIAAILATTGHLDDRARLDLALAVLSQKDLQRMLEWSNEVLFTHCMANLSRNPQTWSSPRRLHWLVHRTKSLLKVSSEAADSNKCDFGPARQLAEVESSDDAKAFFQREIEKDLREKMACDELCGQNSAVIKCPRFQNACEEIVSTLSAWYASRKAIPELETSVSNFMSKMTLFDFDKCNDLALNGKVVCVQAPDGLEVGTLAQEQITKETWRHVDREWYIYVVECVVRRHLDHFAQLITLNKDEKILFDKMSDGVSTLSPFGLVNEVLSMAHYDACVLPSFLLQDKTSSYVPGSYQFFLGIVWPALLNEGWRLDAGDSPTDVTFYMPKATDTKKRSLAALQHEKTKKRNSLFNRVDNIGWGVVGKHIQRLTNLCIPVCPDSNGPADESKGTSATASQSVSSAMNDFVEWIAKDCSSVNEELQERIHSIRDAILNLFDLYAPMMKDELKWQTLNSSERPCDSFGAEALLPVMMLVPEITRTTGSELKEISDVSQVFSDVTSMYCMYRDRLLDKSLCPPLEYYEDQETEKKSILAQKLDDLVLVEAKLEALGNMGVTQGLLTEAVLRSDTVGPDGQKLMTDFVRTVMEQIIPCRATEADSARKFRRVAVGYPGLCCRHCRGVPGEGRYFFSTLESITTASTTLEKHLLKCAHVPAEIKSMIMAARLTHPLQRKELPVGSQQAYFNRLWDRLRSSKLGGAGLSPIRDVYDDAQTTSESGVEFDQAFEDHILILDHLRTHQPWKTTRSVSAALTKYYSCLEYGGRIFYTPDMPQYFTSEWLLAKIVPKKYEYTKATYLPG